MNGSNGGVTVVPLDQVNEIPLPNGSWSKMMLTGDSVAGIVSSLGYSVFTPGTEMTMVSHEVEGVAFVVAGTGELRTEQGVLSLISTVTVFGTPNDVTLAELALETFFPADEASTAYLRQLAQS